MAGRGKAKPQRGQHQGFKRSQLRQARREAEKARKKGDVGKENEGAA